MDAEKNTMIGFSALGLRLTPYLYAHKTHAETKNCFAYIVSRKSGGDGMSSVLIKGMRKPSGCAEFDGNKFIQCPFVNTDDDCILQNKCTGTWKDMYQNCQLVEISPHGRLIDADALKKEYPHDTDWNYPVNTNCYVVESIDNAPTVIEAEEDYE